MRRDLSRMRDGLGEAQTLAEQARAELESADPDARTHREIQHCLGRTGVAVQHLSRAVERLAEAIEALAEAPTA